MSGPSTPNGTPAPKQMSSRLMTMKFMQRAAASKGTGAQTPASEPPSKRRRLEPSSGASTPSRTSESDTKAIPHTPQLGQASHSYTREGGETQWVLKSSRNLPQARVQQPNGHDQENDEADDIWSSTSLGRQTYGSFKRKKDQPASSTPTADKDDGELSSASGSASESDSDPRQRKPAAKAGPGSSRLQSSSNYGSPLTKLPNSKERRKQARSVKLNKKHARKTM